MSHVIEGKTKAVETIQVALLTSKDDLTAGNGAKHDVLEGKAYLANETTCNVFKLLQQFDIPVAFYGKYHSKAFVAPLCRMLPWEVVVRGEAHGSYLKRHSEVEKGHRFAVPLVEFYLKTTGRVFHGIELPCDDPLAHIDLDAGTVELFDPTELDVPGTGFRTIQLDSVFINPDDAECLPRMVHIALQSFYVLQAAWHVAGYNLVDMKVEFGIESDNLLLADVIDNDSWRLIPHQEQDYVDKQAYRDNQALDDVLAKYERVAAATRGFALSYDAIARHLSEVTHGRWET